MENQTPTLPLTIYIGKKPLVIVKNNQDYASPLTADLTLPRLDHPRSAEIITLVKGLEQGDHQGAMITDGADALAQILSLHTIWTAAGGLVRDHERRVLLMFRRGKWDLPKGKLDPEETLEQCALREVTEETGLRHLEIGDKITETWHSYLLEERRILKHTHWYHMEFTGSELTVPQIEEDIQDIQWIWPEHLSKYLAHAHSNIRDVLLKAGLAV